MTILTWYLFFMVVVLLSGFLYLANKNESLEGQLKEAEEFEEYLCEELQEHETAAKIHQLRTIQGLRKRTAEGKPNGRPVGAKDKKPRKTDGYFGKRK